MTRRHRRTGTWGVALGITAEQLRYIAHVHNETHGVHVPEISISVPINIRIATGITT